jgi:hypothetical protein
MPHPHPLRRAGRALAVFALFAAQGSPGQAQQRTAVELEATPYGGTTSGQLPSRGGCAFAPTVGTTFAGLGARARLHQHHDGDRTRGLSVVVQGALEGQSHRLLAVGSDMQRDLPADQTMAAGGLTVGHDWRYVGIHAGGIVREVVDGPDLPCDAARADAACLARASYPRTRANFFPDLRLRGGPSDGLHGELGVGAYSPALLLRPGVHLGVGYTTRRGHDLTARCGLQSTVGDARAARCDLAGSLPLSERVALGLGAAVVHDDDRVDFDTRAAVTVRLGD